MSKWIINLERYPAIYIIIWLIALITLILSAICAFVKGFAELGTGILTLTGTVISLPFFSIPLEIEKEKSLIVNNKRIEGYEKIFFLLLNIQDHFKILLHFEIAERRSKYNSDFHKLFNLMSEYAIYIDREIYQTLLNIKDDIQSLDFSTFFRDDDKLKQSVLQFNLDTKIEKLRNKIQKELGI